jgi:DNA-binding NarL/FixJ family response regulator
MHASPVQPTTPSAAPPRAIRVVTIDDQAVFREAARAIIDHTPRFELVGEAGDGEAALELVREADPDVVILDVRLPGIDGFEVSRRLSSEEPPRVIVLVSSADPSELSDLARRCGAAALLRKHWLTPRLLRGLWVAHRRR